jgi:hypothetical protein
VKEKEAGGWTGEPKGSPEVFEEAERVDFPPD